MRSIAGGKCHKNDLKASNTNSKRIRRIKKRYRTRKEENIWEAISNRREMVTNLDDDDDSISTFEAKRKLDEEKEKGKIKMKEN